MVKELSVKNEELSSEMQKLRTLLGTGTLHNHRAMLQHGDDGSRGHCLYTCCYVRCGSLKLNFGKYSMHCVSRVLASENQCKAPLPSVVW